MPRKAPSDKFVDEVFDELLKAPVWAGPVLALLLYLALGFLIPAMVGGGPMPEPGAVITPLSKMAALPVAGVVLMVWLFAQFQKWLRRR